MTNRDISKVFQLIASLLEIHGENSFKIRSYSFASRVIKQHEQNITQLSAQEIAEISGIGKAITTKITQLVQTGTFPLLDRLREDTPEGLIAMTRLKGLGAKKIRLIWQSLGIDTIAGLDRACANNELLALKGFGAKTQKTIRKGIAFYLDSYKKFRYDAIAEQANWLQETLAKLPDSQQVALTGAFRRKCQVISAIELVMVANWSTLPAHFQKMQLSIAEQTVDFIKGQTVTGTPFCIYKATPETFVNQLFATTATTEHKKQLADLQPNVVEKAASEEVIYQHYNLPYISPELREGTKEIEVAQKNQLGNLLTAKDITGVLHAHSTYSDGQNTLLDMATKCKELGYQYLGITDHSKTAVYAGGLTLEKIERQHQEIDLLNQQLAPFKIFKGIESDILKDGALDYEKDILAKFDFIIASIHNGLDMNEKKATDRLIKAIENPYTTIMGHLTGRLLLERAGYPVDYKKVIDACAANGVMIELNVSPYRLDMDWQQIPYAMEKGVKISINPDAHSLAGISYIDYGVQIARKALLTKDLTFNAQSLEKISSDFF